MVESAVSSLRRVDLVALMVDITRPSAGGDRDVLELVQKVKVPVFLVINKMDRVPNPELFLSWRSIASCTRSRRSFPSLR